MAKINISIPDELLAEVDRLARDLKRSRSGLVAEATDIYVAEINRERVEREREESIRGAMTSMREIAKRVPPGPPAEKIVRRDRDTDHGRLPRRSGGCS